MAFEKDRLCKVADIAEHDVKVILEEVEEEEEEEEEFVEPQHFLIMTPRRTEPAPSITGKANIPRLSPALQSPFELLTLSDLRVLLQKRGLPTSGRKDQMWRALVESLRNEAREAGSKIEKEHSHQTPEKPKLVKDLVCLSNRVEGSTIDEGQSFEKPKLIKKNSTETVSEAFENKLDCGLTCSVSAGLEGCLASDLQKRAEPLAGCMAPSKQLAGKKGRQGKDKKAAPLCT